MQLHSNAKICKILLVNLAGITVLNLATMKGDTRPIFSLGYGIVSKLLKGLLISFQMVLIQPMPRP